MQTIATISFVLIVIGLTVFFVSLAGGTIQERRTKKEHRELLRGDEPVPGCDSMPIYCLVPCLNEALVIGNTVRSLRGDPHTTIVVIDDGSADDTSGVARAAADGDEHVLVVRRELPNAQLGKGAALNAALRHIIKHAYDRGYDASQVIVGVVDADGRLSPGCFGIIRRLFADPSLDGVQLPVKIRNRGRLITDFQDWEFWGVSAVQQHLRGASGGTLLGGNGQFLRLSTLISLGRPPWSDSLTEDLDLALTLSKAGARLISTPSASVNQQGVESLRKLLKQRTRWTQGTIVCIKHLPGVWRSPEIGNFAALEIAVALLAPVVYVLPWSLAFTLGWVFALASIGSLTVESSNAWGTIGRVTLWYLISFGPVLIAGLIYYSRRRRHRRPEDRMSIPRAFVLSNIFVLYNFVNFLGVWIALWRVIRGKTGWDKTDRTAEVPEFEGLRTGPA